MKYFKCTVCGYIHEGSEPPEKCPVCGAPREKFTELPEGEGKSAYDAYMAKMGDKLEGMIARQAARAGEGAPKKEDAGPASVEEARPAPAVQSGLWNFLTTQMAKNHAHPISTHFPNGILPAAVLFLLLAMIFNIAGMPEAAFYNLVFVVLTLPGVMFAGYVDWRVNMGGVMTRVIMTKIVCGIAATIVGLALIIWHLMDPGVTDPGSLTRWTYLLVHLLMLSLVGYAGYLGGEIVFGDGK